MKKKILVSLVIVFCIMLMPIGVEAKTQCSYTLERDGYETINFILETEDNDNKLTRVVTSASYGDVVFANGKGLNLNSNGSCPNIAIYDQRIMGGYKVYKTMNTCRDGWLTDNNRCYELVGTKTDGNTSASNESDSGIQFRLASSDTNSCSYERVYDTYFDNQRVDTITINNRNNNVSGSCDVYLANSCVVDITVPNDFYNNNVFTCPQYLYTDLEAGGRDANNYTYTLYDTGSETDEDRSGPENNEQNWEELGEDVNDSDFGQDLDCPDIIDINDVGSVGWILNTILNYMKIIGPILVVLLSAIDFVKAVVGFDEKAMKEAQNKLIIRLVAAVCLFLVPTLVQLLLSFINQTTCTL